jgi:ubiquinone/menaquinone biosynthesis C-methylase UbiE
VSDQQPKAEFSDVDRAGDPRYYVWCLDQQHAQPFKRLYKRRARELLDLRPGLRVLDVGCGTGQDAMALAALVAPGGGVVGDDVSQTMVDEARQRAEGTELSVSFVREDVHRLSFSDGAFDRGYADRTFQHLADPRQALAEMIRVVTPGGRLLIVDLDHETRVIDTPYKDVTRRFLAWRSDTPRQGGVAHQLYGMFQALGLTDVAVEPLVEVSTDYAAINSVMHFDGGIRLAAEHGVVSHEEAEAWVAYVERAGREGRFFASVTYFLTTGRKPA